MLMQIPDYPPETRERGAEQDRAGERVPPPIRRGDQEVWLLGQPPLSRYLDFVRDTVVDSAAVDRSALIDEWRTANDYYQELERSEAGIANRGTHRELDPGLVP